MACDLDHVREPLRSIAKRIIAESNGRIGCSSGFRTTEQQAQLYHDYITGKPGQARAAKPGHSQHEKGQAVDFSGDMKLLAQLGPKYGLYQPMSDEDWHWQLAGGDYSGDEPTGAGAGFNIGGDANPEDVLASRLTAISRMMGGAGALGGVNGMDTTNQLMDLFPDDPDIQSMGQVSTVPTTPQAGAGNPNEYQKYAIKKMAQKYGWTDQADVNAIIELWNRESNWNPNADNPHSTAAGIAQKLQSVNGPVENTAFGQIDWGLQYIAGRYGSPKAALQWHDRHNWY